MQLPTPEKAFLPPPAPQRADLSRQRGSYTEHIRGARCRVCFQAAHDCALYRRINILYDGRRTTKESIHFAALVSVSSRIRKSTLAGENFVQNQTESIDVTASTNFFAGKLFRRHVSWSSAAYLNALDLSGNSGE